ncbi:MAG: protein kinase [Deltaproteobacteria bacterium]|nr:protein kinase [Deltaproteobacteria bacterium]
MGTVWEAEHTLIGRRVAIKTLRPEFAHSADAVTRFHREAQAASRIGHVNITEVTDLGITEQGAPYIVMEYLEGESLARVLEREKTLPVLRAADIIGQTLGALAAAHAKGIIHRDLKPENIFLIDHGGRADFVKLLDFGISKFQSAAGGDQRLTTTGVALGTPYYMAPEQAAGSSECDHRVDLYASGALLYELMTGRAPYKGSNYNALLAQIVTSDPPPLSDFRPDLDPAFVAVIERAMHRSPGDRYPDAESMLLALLPFGARRTPFAQPSDAPEVPADTVRADPPADLRRGEPAFDPDASAADAPSPRTDPGLAAADATPPRTDPGDLPVATGRHPASYAAVGLVFLGLAAGWLLLRDGSAGRAPAARPDAPGSVSTTPAVPTNPAARPFAPAAAPRTAGATRPTGPAAPGTAAPTEVAASPDAGAPSGPDAARTPLDGPEAAVPAPGADATTTTTTADARRPDARRRLPDDGGAAAADGVIRVRGYTAHTNYGD